MESELADEVNKDSPGSSVENKSETNSFNDNPIPTADSAQDDPEDERKHYFDLRVNYLRNMSNLTGFPCEILTLEKNRLTGVFRGMNTASSVVAVESLQTPHELMAHAIVRVADVINMEFLVDEKLKSVRPML